MNESLLQDVQQGNAVPHQFVDMAKQLNAENDVFAWHDVLAEQDAAELMYVRFGHISRQLYS